MKYGTDAALSDSQLLEATAAGDREAWGELHRRYYDRMARRFGEDVSAEAMLRVGIKANTFDAQRGAASSWIWKIAANVAVDVARSCSRLRLCELVEWGMPDECPCPSQRMMDREREMVVAKAICRLKEPMRQAVALRYSAGLSVEEVATELRVPYSTVKNRLFRGREELRHVLGGFVCAS